MTVSRDDRLFAMLIYAITYFTAFIGPIVIWFLKKDDSDFVDFHGRQYFNFLITLSLMGIVGGILVIIAIGVLILWLIGIYALVFTIIAAIKAYEGEYYRIPFTVKIF